MLAADSRIMIDATVMPDRRVEQFWDGDKVASAWFAREIDSYEGYAWDVYYLYGPDAEWQAIPGPLVASNGTVLGEGDALLAALAPLLEHQ